MGSWAVVITVSLQSSGHPNGVATGASIKAGSSRPIREITFSLQIRPLLNRGFRYRDGVHRPFGIRPDRAVRNGIDDIHTVYDTAKYRILAIPLRFGSNADEKLARRAVNVVLPARHRYDSAHMLDGLGKLALDRLLARLSLSPGRRIAADRIGIAALNRNQFAAGFRPDYSVKLGAIEEAVASKLFKVSHVLWRFLREEFYDDASVVCLEHRDIITCARNLTPERRQGDYDEYG